MELFHQMMLLSESTAARYSRHEYPEARKSTAAYNWIDVVSLAVKPVEEEQAQRRRQQQCKHQLPGTFVDRYCALQALIA